jgi:hypothetical protein
MLKAGQLNGFDLVVLILLPLAGRLPGYYEVLVVILGIGWLGKRDQKKKYRK